MNDRKEGPCEDKGEQSSGGGNSKCAKTLKTEQASGVQNRELWPLLGECSGRQGDFREGKMWWHLNKNYSDLSLFVLLTILCGFLCLQWNPKLCGLFVCFYFYWNKDGLTQRLSATKGNESIVVFSPNPVADLKVNQGRVGQT